jgi:hypothetical protein
MDNNGKHFQWKLGYHLPAIGEKARQTQLHPAANERHCRQPAANPR